jgi:hypothetical protein
MNDIFLLTLCFATAYTTLPTIKIESELSTILDFDEIRLGERIGEGLYPIIESKWLLLIKLPCEKKNSNKGSFGVVFSGVWRKQPVAVKLLRQQQFNVNQVHKLTFSIFLF